MVKFTSITRKLIFINPKNTSWSLLESSYVDSRCCSESQIGNLNVFVCFCLQTCLLAWLLCYCFERLSQNGFWSLRSQVHTTTPGWKRLIHGHLFLTGCKLVTVYLLSKKVWLTISNPCQLESIHFLCYYFHYLKDPCIYEVYTNLVHPLLPHTTSLQRFHSISSCTRLMKILHALPYLWLSYFVSRFTLINWKFSSHLPSWFLLNKRVIE